MTKRSELTQAAHYVLLGSCGTAWKRIARSDALRNFIERCAEGFGTRGEGGVRNAPPDCQTAAATDDGRQAGGRRYMQKLLAQIAKFGVVGVIAFVIDYGLLALLTEAFGVNY